MSILTSGIEGGFSIMCSWLMHTCKDHKPAGEVRFRPVHGSSGHVFQGLMPWLNLIMGTTSGKFKHLLTSCDCLLKDLSFFEPPEDMVMLHYDLKDFCMMGTPSFLAHHASMVLPLQYRSIAKKALVFILENQILGSRLLPGEFWRVTEGSGMGLKVSSNVANLAFMHSSEMCGIGILSARFSLLHRVVFYRRFRDNLMFSASRSSARFVV